MEKPSALDKRNRICFKENAEYDIFWHNSFLKIQLLQSRFAVDELLVSYVARTASFGLL